LLDLNDAPLDVILKKNAKEPSVNFWEVFEACPLQMVYPPMDNVDCVDIKIVTTRPYNLVKPN
jgi:hypothetical protein